VDLIGHVAIAINEPYWLSQIRWGHFSVGKNPTIGFSDSTGSMNLYDVIKQYSTTKIAVNLV